MRDESYCSSQSQKLNSARKNLVKSVIAINNNKETFNTDKKLASSDEKTINDDIQTNVNKNNCIVNNNSSC